MERHVLSVEPGSLGALCPLRLQVGSMLPRLAVSVHTTVFRPFVKEPSGDSDAVGLSFCPVSLNSTGLWLLQSRLLRSRTHSRCSADACALHGWMSG